MVNFVGAGSGAPDLITLRGQRLLSAADVIIYAGSLVNPQLLEYAKDGCEIHNSAKMTLDEVIDVIKRAEKENKNTVRLHTGDPCVFGAIREQIDRLEAQNTAQMLSYADKSLHDHGYHPYYLYRQSRMVGNLENTGWSKPGKEGYYNVFIMDETQTILAVGAGAVTKLSAGMSDIERIFNYKYPYEYIDSRDFFSREQYYTALLIQKTKDTYLSYNKRKLNISYLQDKEKGAVIKVMPEQMFE